jgi:hypothetical protein
VQFWRLTFREYVALVREVRRSERRKDHRAGLQAAVTANTSMAAPKQALVPSDFYPSLAGLTATRADAIPKTAAEAKRMAKERAERIKAGLKSVWG